MSLTYRASTGAFILISDDDEKAKEVGLTLSTSIVTQSGKKVWFTADDSGNPVCNPYAALPFWNEADDLAKEQLLPFYGDYAASWHPDSENVHPVKNGQALLPYQNAAVDFCLQRPNNVIGDEMGLGKQSPVDTKVLTPGGWVEIGSLRIGDFVIGSDGRPTEVVGVFPQGVKPAYTVRFRDGTSTECGLEHLWAVKDNNMTTRGKDWVVKSTAQLLKQGLKTKSGTNKWQIPLVAPVEFSTKGNQIIDPYIFGVLLGDGYICGSRVTFSNPDVDSDITERVRARLPEGYSLSENRSAVCPRYTIVYGLSHGDNPIGRYLRDLNLRVKSADKFIPDVFLFANVSDRKELLYGLMDTDGSCCKNRSVFHTISKEMALGVAHLVRSLGGVAIIRGYDRSAEGKPYEYHVNVKTMFCPFTTKRKASEWAPPYRNQRPTKHIDSVSYSRDTEQVCIKVSNPDGLYVVENFIVTHNTPTAIAISNVTKAKRTLVVCPASIRLGWEREIKKFSTVPDVSVYVILKTSKGVSYNTDYVVVSYDMIRNEALRAAICAIEWDHLILDEVHYVKTIEAKRSKAVFGAPRSKKPYLAQKAKRITALTGTPLLNRPRECYTIVRGLAWDAIDYMSYDSFCYRYNPSNRYEEKQGRLPELQARLRCNLMVRRLKDDVRKDLPDKRFEFAYVEENGAISAVLAKEKLIDFDPERLLNDNFSIEGQISTVRREMGEAKVPRVIEHMKYLLEVVEVPKVIMFSHHRSVMDALKEGLSKYGVVEVRGGVTPRAKQSAIDRFVLDPSTRIFSGQIDSAGEGIDGLQTVSSRVVFSEPSWVPGKNEQCVDRAHRHGQKDNVIAEFLVAEGSLDEKILESVLRKKRHIHASLDGGVSHILAAE